VVWENVPGVLSSNGGRDFGSFLGGLGVIGYGWAYATLDAQYFGLAQRRARVFVVGRLGDWRGPCAVLFERASLSGDSAPRREAGQRASRPVAGSSATSSGYRNDADRADDLIPAPTLSHPLAQALTQSGRGVQRVGEPRGQDPVIATQAPPQVVGSMPASGGTEKKHGHGWGQQEWESGYIQAVEGAPPAPSQVHGPPAPTPALAFKPGQSERAGGVTATEEFAPTLQGQDNNLIPAIAFALRGRAEGAQPEIHRDGDQASALRSASGGSSRDYVAFQANGRDEVRLQGGDGDQAGSLAATGGVRRGTTTLLAFDTTQLSHPENRSNPKPGGPAPTLAPGASAPGASAPAIAFSIVPEGGQGSALRASEITTAPALTPTAEGRSTDRGARIVTPAPQGFTLHGADQTVSTATPTELAAALRARTPGKIENATTTAVLAPAAPTASAVRRLTPTECERLQGFPDGYTQVIYRGKPAADGPRYKALGNSMAVPCMSWLGRRIQMCEEMR
jgi:DNA (cytosine-5)-methyltransferase 1